MALLGLQRSGRIDLARVARRHSHRDYRHDGQGSARGRGESRESHRLEAERSAACPCLTR